MLCLCNRVGSGYLGLLKNVVFACASAKLSSDWCKRICDGIGLLKTVVPYVLQLS